MAGSVAVNVAKVLTETFCRLDCRKREWLATSPPDGWLPAGELRFYHRSSCAWIWWVCFFTRLHLLKKLFRCRFLLWVGVHWGSLWWKDTGTTTEPTSLLVHSSPSPFSSVSAPKPQQLFCVHICLQPADVALETLLWARGRQTWSEGTLPSMRVHNLLWTAACPGGGTDQRCDLVLRAGKAELSCLCSDDSTGWSSPQTLCGAEQVCERTEHLLCIHQVFLQPRSSATDLALLAGVHHICTAKVESEIGCVRWRAAVCSDPLDLRISSLLSLTSFTPMFVLICGVICSDLNVLSYCILSRMEGLRQIRYVLFTVKYVLFTVKYLTWHNDEVF